MTEQTSAGLRFRQALEVEKPLQIIGTVNAYAAMMAIFRVLVLRTTLTVFLIWE